MRLMHKTYLFLLKWDSCLQLHLKFIGYTDTVRFPSTGKAGDVLSPYFGKSDIYPRKVQVSRQPISIFIGHPDKNLLPTYLNFYNDRYPTYQQLGSTVSLYPTDFHCGISILRENRLSFLHQPHWIFKFCILTTMQQIQILTDNGGTKNSILFE